MNRLTIVMYHYVRELARTRFPEIKALSVSSFLEQLGYLARHYEFVTVEQCLASLNGEASLPKNGLLLTFDDGYLDHYLNVFPILEERKIQGCFFPPAAAVLESRVLDVNKIHFLLACVDPGLLLNQIFSLIDEYRRDDQDHLKSEKYYRRTLATTSRYDSPAIVLIKALLQHALPSPVRAEIVSNLFRKYVTTDEQAFAAELYMNVDQIRLMLRHNMYFGNHGYEHVWLDKLNLSEQEQEIERSLAFLNQIGANTQAWLMCYPYGVYDKKLLTLLKKRGCKMGFTTEVGIATPHRIHSLRLPRLDTNDLPKVREAERHSWTLAALADISPPGHKSRF